MAFTYFDQPTLSPVDISLYADADRAGIDAGNAQPSTTSSILQGITQGAKTGMDLYKSYQDITTTEQEQQIRANEIANLGTKNKQAEATLTQTEQLNQVRANQISRLPQANKLADAQLKHFETANEINSLKLAEDKAIQETHQAMTLAEQKAKTAEAEKFSRLSAAEQKINSNQGLYASDPETARNTLLNDPAVGEYLQNNPDKWAQITQMYAKNGWISEQETTQLLNAANSYKELDAQAKIAKANGGGVLTTDKQLQESINTFKGDSIWTPDYIASGRDPVKTVTSNYLLESGSYTKNPDGTVNLAVPQNFKSAGEAATFDIVDTATNKVKRQAIPKASADKFTKMAMSVADRSPAANAAVAKWADRGQPTQNITGTPETAPDGLPLTVEQATAKATKKGVPNELLQSIQAEARTRGANASLFERMSTILPSWLDTNQVDATAVGVTSDESGFTTKTRSQITSAATDFAGQTIDKLQSGTPEEKDQVRAFLKGNDLEATIPSLREYYADQLRSEAADVYDAEWSKAAGYDAAAIQARAGALKQEEELKKANKGKGFPELVSSAAAVSKYNAQPKRAPQGELPADFLKKNPEGVPPVTPDEAKVKAKEVAATTNMSKAQTDSFVKTASTVVAHPLLADQPAYVQALAAVESGGKTGAKSPTGVQGLLQVTRATAAQYGLNRDIPEQGVEAGKLYIEDLVRVFNGNWQLAYAAYNAGPGVIKYAQKLADDPQDWNSVKAHLLESLQHFKDKGAINVDPVEKWKETSNYPEKVTRYQAVFA